MAAGLGLVSLAPAAAGCAGAVLELEQSGVPVLPARPDEDAEPVHPVSRDQPLRVTASNVHPSSSGCQDTSTGGGGCHAAPSPPPPSTPPVTDVGLVVTQQGRRWTLAVADTGVDHRVRFDVALPPGLRPGPATLLLVSATPIDTAPLQLLVS